MSEYELFIDGASTPAEGGATFESINPATEQVWATISAASAADVDRAVKAARRSFDEGVWRDLPASERAAVLRRCAEMFIERQDELALAEIQDGGGTFRKANTADIPTAMNLFNYYADLIEAQEQEVEDEEFIPVPSRNIIRREPIGVVGAITPFNFPFAAASWKVAPALAAGCSIVLKPSPLTPVSTLLMAQMCHEAGVPAGVFNVITGPGAAAGEALVSHPDLDKIAFTGSTAVGRAVARAAAENVVPVSLELGGKSANVILRDANLDGAIRGALFGVFFHTGQICQSGTRLLVPRDMHDDIVARLVEEAAKISVGDPMDPMNTMGPLVSEQQRATTERYVAGALEQGAKVACGGRRPDGLDTGWYYEPTILTGVTPDMTVACEEVFGPVLSVIAYDDEAEALRMANDSQYGLAGAVWTTDIERGLAFARGVRAGTFWVNDYHLLTPKYEFGGFKKSGFGRELGPSGLSAFQQVRHIHVGEATGVDDKYYFGMLID